MTPFDLQRMLLHDFPLMFVAEVALRALFAFVAVFVFLKVSGRRGIRQLSVFELVIILTLGSAAGDVSFYEDVPLLPVAVVFATLLALYRLTVFFMNRSTRFGAWLEGKPVTIIRDGIYELRSLDSLNISADEFFMELRQQGVEHLGQVRLGILENDGNVSLFFHEPEAVRPGLSVLPPEYRPVFREVPASGMYACSHCGFPQALETHQRLHCPRCDNQFWSKALATQRAR
ncbi:DUF421 domain-containing protein [Pseudomonas lopnurensis]|uniref:DUF421 domain-containing protein n=1 Tax=Pseudomonas lopnurensis TaxID=1477517 RepID=UPI00187A77E1|nr:DUF421 domain-containing protein [Pseudomonas lopnurensis]MBE7374736.1 DUF421 domain-containing protein [Pseudomonas lopnurensis]